MAAAGDAAAGGDAAADEEYRGFRRPAKRAKSRPDAGRHEEYVVLLMLNEDSGFERALNACREACASHPEVQSQCGQWDGTRHVTLIKGMRMTRAEADEVRYTTPPNLPLHLTPTRLLDWDSTVALGFSGDLTEDHAALTAGLRGLPAKRTVVMPMHISLYRSGRAGMPKDLKDLAKGVVFPAIRAACPRTKSNTSISFGSVSGVKVVIKPLGGAYDDSSWRVLASSGE